MNFKLTYILPIILFTLYACNQTKYVPEGEHLLKKYELVQVGDKLDKADLNSIVRQQANYKRIGVKWKLLAYNSVDSTKVAEKRVRKNIKLRKKNAYRISEQERINTKRIAKAKAKGKEYYTHKTIKFKDTLEPKKFLREWYKYKVGEQPVVFDSILYNKSIEQLGAYLKKKGFYYGDVHGQVEYKKHNKCVVKYLIETGERYYIDSTQLICTNPEVAQAYEAYCTGQHDPPLIGEPFDGNMLDSYRSRVAKFMRDSSFYGFSANSISYIVDTSRVDMTVNVKVLIADRIMRSKENRDSMIFIPYQKTFVKEVYFHVADTTLYEGNFSQKMDDMGLSVYSGPFFNTIDSSYYARVKRKGHSGLDSSRMVVFKYNGRPFVRPEILEMQNFLEKGKHYQERGAESSYSNLLQMNIFKAIKTELVEVPDTNLIEVHYYVMPSKKQSFSFAPRATTSNGFLGVTASAEYSNRNIFHGGEKLTISLMGGLESQPAVFGPDVDGNVDVNKRHLNTFEIGPSIELTLPGFFPVRMSRISKRRRPETILSTAYNYQNRSEFERGSFQLNYSWKFIVSKTSLFELGLPFASVVKYINITKTEEFEEKLIDLNDLFLLNSYSDQFAWQDWRVRYEYNIKDKPNRKGNSKLYFSTVFDPAGNVLSLFQNYQDTLENGQFTLNRVAYSQFVRVENDLIFAKPYTRERSINMRFQLGAGYPYGNTSTSMPYDYSFFGGGSNDNRGWRARSLGPGAYKYYLDLNRTTTQIGDFKLGASAEYRFSINSLLKGAVFMDAGNVWTIFHDENRPGGQLSNTWWNEIAVATGFGVRMDFKYFIIRFDLGMPIRNPALPNNEKWIFQRKDEFKQEGIDTFGDPAYKDLVPAPYLPNLHFGIGYPF